MFEGKPPRTADALPLEEPQEGESLRPLSWTDLVARLSAVRDMRASLEGRPASDASFDASSARCVAALHNGKHGVNPEDSSNGKSPHGMANPAGLDGPSGVART